MMFDGLHPRLRGFERFYEADIAPQLLAIEGERKAAFVKAIPIALAALAIGLPIAMLPILFPGRISADDEQIVVVVGLLVVAGGLWLAYRPLAKVRSKGKSVLVGGLCSFLGLHFSEAAGSFEFGLFLTHRLVPSHDRRKLEDYIAGDEQEVSFELCDAHLEERRHSTDSKGRSRTRYVTVFRGQLLKFSFPKPFRGHTVISRDGGMIGNFFKGFGQRGERVSLESPEFEKLYEVHSNDQVEARYLLTPTFMERLVELARVFRHTPQLAFVDNRLMIAVNTGEDYFEGGSAFSNLADPKYARALAEEISLVFQIIETLQLQLKTRA